MSHFASSCTCPVLLATNFICLSPLNWIPPFSRPLGSLFAIRTNIVIGISAWDILLTYWRPIPKSLVPTRYRLSVSYVLNLNYHGTNPLSGPFLVDAFPPSPFFPKLSMSILFYLHGPMRLILFWKFLTTWNKPRLMSSPLHSGVMKGSLFTNCLLSFGVKPLSYYFQMSSFLFPVFSSGCNFPPKKRVYPL